MSKTKPITFSDIHLAEVLVVYQGEIRNLLDTIVDTGKTQVEFLKAIPEHVKEKLSQDNINAIAGTLRDRDAELDNTLVQIEKDKNTYTID